MNLKIWTRIISFVAFFFIIPAFDQPLMLNPPGKMGPYLNGIFPESTPGENGLWELEEAFPGISFDNPLKIISFPYTNDLLLLTKSGEIWQLNLEAQTRKIVFDIKENSFSRGDAGAIGIALHPNFGNPFYPDKQLLYLFYRWKPQPDKWSEQGFNRLSVVPWDPLNEIFVSSSERILIQQYDRSTWHNGGSLFFDDQGYLYIGVGDEGHAEYLPASNQKLNGGFFAGVLRIDVDNNPSRSHPIRRQPKANAKAPDGWGNTFSQGYFIPNDNPWQSPDSSHLEEYYALGIRSPYAMSFDQETKQIWLADVGSNVVEEINLIEKGGNYLWPYYEGSTELDFETNQGRDQLIGEAKEVFWEYDRTYGACVIGGAVYRNSLFSELNGKYLFADYTSNKIMALNSSANLNEEDIEVLIGNLNNQPVEVPKGAGITGIFETNSGEVLITVIGNRQEKIPGKIYRLRRNNQVPDPPFKLSEIGFFKDLENLEPIDGVIPYQVNAPLWSDRALKKRWIALPNDGSFNEANEKITFNTTEPWTFPEGTVFIKHFELPQTDDPNGKRIRLETRFFVLGKDKKAYGLTYKWNEEGTEAYLLGGGDSRVIEVEAQQGSLLSQTWTYPSREQCMSCHNATAGYVLGVKTVQLNSELFYPNEGQSLNQLDYLNRINVFNYSIAPGNQYPKAFAIDDIEASLDIRIQSYFDANCAPCHQHDIIPELTMDLSWTKPLFLKNIINTPANSHASNPMLNIVEPGNHQVSELWLRDVSEGPNRMPPLGRNLVDQVYIEALAEWIDQLTIESTEIEENILFPNPTKGVLRIKINDNWEAPFDIEIWTTNGKLLHRARVTDNLYYYSTHHLSKGLYLIKIRAGENRFMDRFVVQ